MRVDTPEQAAAFDNMETRPIVTAEWRQFAVVLNVAPDALGFTFGGILADTGQAWWSDLRLEVVGPDVATTGGPAPGRYTATESATMRSMYANALPAPVNLELSARELVTSLPAIAWLRREAIPFQSAEPTGVVTDLAFLRGMVGDARLVGLGEATHGTREHFQMKHRILQYLVRELGFTALAMEASWPEANDIDLYVRTGRGDPAVLLSNLYFWTWNTQEVLDMIRWMREYNATMPPARQVRFLGFDMQFPGTAMDTVTAFVRRVDPALAPAVDSAYACLAPYRNRRQTAGPLRYDRADAAVRATCRAAVTRVHADLVAAAPRHLARVSAEEQARAVQSARLVVQWEDMAADGGTGTARDRYMAENVAWLRAQLPAGTRMALWAHNQHLANVRDAQGSYLRTWYGADYRIIGFTFGTGAFNARPITDGVLGTPRALTTTRVIGGSFEAHAEATTLPRFAVDVRRVTGATDAAALTRAPMRNVGAAFDTRRPELYFGTVRLPEQYDVLIHFRTSTPTRLLPFRFE